MNGKVLRITRYREKGKAGERLDEAKLLAGLGLEGNIKQGGERQVCLLSAREWDCMGNRDEKGLCSGRFKENILVGGLPPEEMRSGGRLAIGEAVLRVSAQTKKCFDECPLFSKGTPCLLSRCAAYAGVERGGVIRVGDGISVMTDEAW